MAVKTESPSVQNPVFNRGREHLYANSSLSTVCCRHQVRDIFSYCNSQHYFIITTKYDIIYKQFCLHKIKDSKRFKTYKKNIYVSY